MSNPFKKGEKQPEKSPKTYFEKATEWATDRYGLLENRLYQCKCALTVSGGLNCLLVIAVMMLASNQKLIPMLVHHYPNGVVTIDAMDKNKAPVNKAQIQSDISRFIVARESYDISSYHSQFELMALLANSDVADEYEKEQSHHNSDSPINRLGDTGSRKVHIYSIDFLDKEALNTKGDKRHKNLAQVVFSVQEHDRLSRKSNQVHYSAVVSWRYLKPSDNPQERWLNFDGFQVTRYTKSVRNN